MKTFFSLLCLFAPAVALAAAPSAIDTVIDGIPPAATEVVVAIDTVAPPAPEESAGPAAPQQQILQQLPAAAKGAAPAPRAGQRRGFGRRGRGGQAAAGGEAHPSLYRSSVKPAGASSVTVHLEVPAGANYRVRAVALGGSDPFPTVLAGGRETDLEVDAGEITAATVSLSAPVLALAPATPASVKANEHYILAGTITDDAEFLGTKNRMRVWFSSGAPPAANYDGAQTSTVIVTSQGDTIAFTFELTAPKDPTTLYFQLGEVSPDFARKDGSQAAFLVLPDLSLGAKPLTLQVTPAGATAVAAVSKN